MANLARRLVVPLAVVTAIALVVAWFPTRTLLAQRHEISGTQRQISVLDAESARVAAERRELSTSAAETELARSEYQLVRPGQRLIQVLTTGQSSDTFDNGDPGNQPLAAPSSAAGLLPVAPKSTVVPAHRGGGFWSSVVRTLEFWR